MQLLIDYPELTEAYAPHFKDCFSEAGYIHFKKFISGLLVSPNKTIESINRLFVLDRRNQSSMNKFMNRNNFDLEELANRRISLMQQS